MEDLILVFLLGIVSSYLSNISGGGGYFILLPALLHLGIPPLPAIGTIKFGAIGMMFGSFVSAKNKNVIRRDYLKPLIIITAITSILGPQLAFAPSDEAVKLISSIIIIITALASLASWRMAGNSREVTKRQKYLGYGLFFILSTVFAGFGSGLGILVNYVLIGFLGMSAVETISTRRAVAIVGIPIQLIFFIGHGEVNIPLGFALVLGCAIGGFLGLNTAIRKGNMFVKRAMALVAIILVISLFL